MVTVFLALCACFSDNCLESKLARDGEGRCAGEVFERASLRVGRICNEVVEVAATVCGKRVKPGDFVGCGDVALRCGGLIRSLSCSSLMVLSFSSVACRRSRSDDFGLLPAPLELNTPLNMMLYRSSLTSGISMSKRPLPLGEGDRTIGEEDIEGTGSEVSSLSSILMKFGRAGDEIVFDLMIIGLCFPAFVPPTVLLLAGVAASPLGAVTVMDTVLRFASAFSIVLGCSACFLPPNKDANNLLFCVLVLWITGSGVGCRNCGCCIGKTGGGVYASSITTGFWTRGGCQLPPLSGLETSGLAMKLT